MARAAADPQMRTKLAEQYWPAVVAFLQYSGYPPDRAMDVAHSFVCDRLLQDRLFAQADRKRGRFRTYLIRALKNYAVDLHRARDPAVDRPRGEAAGPEGSRPRPLFDPATASSPEDAFEREWAAGVVRTALANLRESYEGGAMDLHWRAFVCAHCDLVQPGVRSAPDHSTIAAEIGARDAAHVSMLLNTVRRRFRAILEDLLRAEGVHDDELDEEIAELRSRLR